MKSNKLVYDKSRKYVELKKTENLVIELMAEI